VLHIGSCNGYGVVQVAVRLLTTTLVVEWSACCWAATRPPVHSLQQATSEALVWYSLVCWVHGGQSTGQAGPGCSWGRAGWLAELQAGGSGLLPARGRMMLVVPRCAGWQLRCGSTGNGVLGVWQQ
jgi:hypothetical protein